MNKFIKGAIALSLAVTLVTIPTGCSTTGGGSTPEQNAARIATVAELAAYTGTSIWLKDHPLDRPYFEASRATLGILLQSTNISPADFTAAMQKLPIKELRGETGALIVNTAVILYDGYAAQNVNLDANVYLRPVVTAVFKGLSKGLGL